MQLPPVPRGYVLVISVGEYRNLDASWQLLFAQSDAEAMYRVLISHEGGAFPPENVRLLTGAQATLSNVRHAIDEWLASVATPADRVVVYFAGHGFVRNGRGYRLRPTSTRGGWKRPPIPWRHSATSWQIACRRTGRCC